MKLSPYHISTYTEGNGLVVYSTVTGQMHAISSKIYDLLIRGNYDKIDQSVIEALKGSKILLDNENTVLPTMERDKLGLVILPTNMCNLRCVYCGEQKGTGVVNKKTQEDIVCFAEKHMPGKHTLDVAWFGGEPTLNMESIRSLTLGLKEVTKRYGADYRSRMVTNGILLTENNIRILVEECSISYIEITLDGYGEYNDLRRKNSHNQGFYEEIIQNVQRLCEHDVTISVRCNVDQTNKDGVFPLLEDLKRRGLHNRIGFYIAMLHSWGSENGSLALPVEEFAKVQMEVLRYKQENDFSLSTEEILPYREQVRKCTASGEDAFVIDHHGYIYQCSEQPYTDDKEAIIGHVSRTMLHRKDFSIPREIISKCFDCPIYPICGGGCPKRCKEHGGNLECIPLLYNIHERIKFFVKNKKSKITAKKNES